MEENIIGYPWCSILFAMGFTVCQFKGCSHLSEQTTTNLTPMSKSGYAMRWKGRKHIFPFDRASLRCSSSIILKVLELLRGTDIIGRKHGLVSMTWNSDSRELDSIPCSATVFLCNFGKVTESLCKMRIIIPLSVSSFDCKLFRAGAVSH